MDSRRYNEAVEHFSTILSLDRVDRMDVFIKRSKARMLTNSWGDALSDADEVSFVLALYQTAFINRVCRLPRSIRHLTSATSRGMQHCMVQSATLKPLKHSIQCFRNWTSLPMSIFEVSHSLKITPDHRVLSNRSIIAMRNRYIDAGPTIREIVEETVCDMPRILINTTTGRLYDKGQQAEAFEALPIYFELVSSMTTDLDYARIQRVVKEFYRYVMLSHRWQRNEPTFQLVETTPIYGLPPSPGNIKLQKFCELVCSLRFEWAWSDTCCVNQLDKGVQQESLVAMFRWYRGSSLTVIHLLGVLSDSQEFGCLWRSIWNTRGWTYQEYIASEVVQFYTEDWKPYLGLDALNHKESPTILLEMERAMNLATQELATLRPGLDRVREKLYLASARQTTREEDIAYSLFGIFNIAIPVIYGEGDQAVGRLLEHVLTGSGDVTILAWTGTPGSYNSCLPAGLTVYNYIVPPHVPQPIQTTEMDNMVTALRSSLPDLSLAVMLHNQVDGLQSPFLAASRLRLPSFVFRLTKFAHTSGLDRVTNLHLYRVTTSTFGDIEVKTTQNLTGMQTLYLVHPWIRPLLDQEFSHDAAALDGTTQALRFVARLRQPFGALLLESLSRVEYRRVAADSLIMVQVREEVPLTDLIASIRTIEVQ